MKIIIQAIVDKQNSQSVINAQIKQIKTEALKVGLSIDDKEAKKHLTEFNQMQAALAKTEQNRLKERETLEKKQAVAINKNLEDEYKQRLKLEEQQKRQIELANKQAEAERKSNINLDLDKLKLTSKIEAWAASNTKALKVFGSELDNIKNQIESADSFKLSNLNKEFDILTNNVKAVGLEGRSFGDELKNSFAKFTSWFSIASIVTSAIRDIQKAIITVRELDSAMVELKKVTDETDATYTKFFDNASVRASKLGAELKDVITASSDFARLGFNIKDSETLADVAILYKNVGDNINNVSDASSSIISTMKAFGISVEDSMHIVDAFNAVGNNFSISSKNIGVALLDSASSLSAANNTFEESIGLIASAYDIVQDASQVGNGLKTISMRLRNTAGELQELGEDSEGAAESVTKLQTQLLNLTQGKVNIMDGTDSFKSTYDILMEISSVWDTLSDTMQADITRLVAGIHRGNIFEALMKNMSTGAEAAETAINSQNSALEENERHLNSIQGKIDLYNAALQKLSATTVDSNLVKRIVEGGTTALTILEKIISSLGTIPILVTAIVTAMSIKNNAGKVNMPTIYEVISDTSVWESCIYHTGGKPLDCWKGLRAA